MEPSESEYADEQQEVQRKQEDAQKKDQARQDKIDDLEFKSMLASTMITILEYQQMQTVNEMANARAMLKYVKNMDNNDKILYEQMIRSDQVQMNIFEKQIDSWRAIQEKLDKRLENLKNPPPPAPRKPPVT